MQAKENLDAKREVQLSLHDCISITYFTNRANSHVLHDHNQANVTIMRKKISLKIILSLS